MHEAGLQPNRPRLKAARVVGDVMGNYHPHGDQAIYDTLVRMAQPFSLRYPLVDGQGNFGNIDDYPAAAMRYTEARLTRLATEMLRDIDMDTIDFRPNYDESRREPTVLPSRFPNLLVNGSAGIAVGMATNMPPHRLGEVVDAVLQLIDKPDANVEDLMKHVKGPDFPSGAIVVGRTGIRDAYRTGRGRVIMRARAHVEELRGGRNAIIVTELPYGVKKGGDSGVIKKIAELVNDKVLTEVSDVKDHSDRSGMRIQIDLKREAIPQVALNKLFKHTSMQTTFGYNAVALVDGVPRTLSLLELITHYLDYQTRDRHPALEVRAAEGRRSRPHPRGLPHRARQPRRGDRADPGGRRHRVGAHGAREPVRSLRAPGSGDPRSPPPCAHGARAKASRGRVRGPPGAHRRAPRAAGRSGPDRRRRSRGAARDQADLRQDG